MEFILGCIYFAVTGAVIFSMSVLFLRGEKNIANKIYMCCHLMVAIWCSSQLLMLLSKSNLELIISYMYGNIGICFAGAFWILFSVTYNNPNYNGIKFKYLIPFILSGLHYIAIATNGLHKMYYSSFDITGVTHGPLFYSNVVETYLFIATGAFVLFRRINATKKNTDVKKNLVQRLGGVLIVAAVAIPVIFSILYLSGIVAPGFDITPLGFAVSVILVRYATNKLQFFDMKRELDITTEKLLLEKERNRIAQQVHDTAGHTLTMIQSYLKLTEVSVNADNKSEALEYITEGRSLTSKGIKELRESINHLREGENFELVTQAAMQLANSVKEMPCEVTIQGEDNEKYSHLTRIIYDTIRESITNTLKYAHATRIDIIIRFHNDKVELMIADDGIGCNTINDNNGLRGIRERVEKVNGTVRFTSSENEGFMTRVKIPV